MTDSPLRTKVYPARAVAMRFVRARREARALSAFPGPPPADLAQGYAVQDVAMTLETAEVGGWKVGRIPAALEAALGAGRLAGPVFEGSIWRAEAGRPVDAPVFIGGFAAVEAEYVLRLGRDVDPAQTRWTLEEAADLADALFVGVEMAGSPLATINEFGPTVVVSDFGNNAGLILGPPIDGWRTRSLETLVCETFVDGASVGAGGAANLLDGPVGSLRFLLELLAARGHRLRKGALVSTGAATGIHEIRAGQSAEARFGADGAIELRAVAARPRGGA